MTRYLPGILAMAIIVVASNILVQFTVGLWLTWGAFTYPFAFLVTDVMNRVYGAPAAPFKWGINPDWTFNATNPAEFWSGASQQGTLVLLLNPSSATTKMTANFAEIPELKAGGTYQALDVWAGKDLGSVRSSLTVSVASHDTAALLFTS